jgi:hypothetical protein
MNSTKPSIKKLLMGWGMAVCCGCLLAATGCSNSSSQGQNGAGSAVAATVQSPATDPNLTEEQKAQAQQYIDARMAQNAAQHATHQ